MNNIDQVLQYVDDLMFEKVASHLTPVQEAILTGVWQGQKYWQIAQSFNGCSESHIKKEAANLWKKLGKVLDEDVNKDNLRSKLERKYRVSQTSNFGHCLQVNQGNIHICDQSLQTINNGKKTKNFLRNDDQSPIIDLTKAPELRYNYGRKLEISTLKEWLDNKTRLITIYGLSGIGKTALTLKLISEIATEFDYIIYRSLENVPKLIVIKDDLKRFFAQAQSPPLPDIIDYLICYRCLIILDDMQNIFKTGKLAGQYLHEYQDYDKWFNRIATLSHQSCLILISWELSSDLEILEREHQYTQILNLQGLGEDAKEILRDKDLKNQEMWDKLINLYQSNPSWLNIIISTILELFDGDVELFLSDQENNIYLGDLEPIIESHLQRLSVSETKLIYWLASQNEGVNMNQKPANSELSKAEFLQAIKSLMRRCLVEKVPIDKRSLRHTSTHFKINFIFKQYLSGQRH